MTAPALTPPPDYDVNRVPAAIKCSEVTTRNQQSTARHMTLWTAWRVDSDSVGRFNRIMGRQAHRKPGPPWPQPQR